MMNKVDRINVLMKFDKKCAYCGCEITMRNFQVDHISPIHLSNHYPDIDVNRFENLNPSCRKCNNFKHSWTLEEFRKNLQDQVRMLKENSQFDRALRYGQIKITESPIVFYFETVAGAAAISRRQSASGG